MCSFIAQTTLHEKFTPAILIFEVCMVVPMNLGEEKLSCLCEQIGTLRVAELTHGHTIAMTMLPQTEATSLPETYIIHLALKGFDRCEQAKIVD